MWESTGVVGVGVTARALALACRAACGNVCLPSGAVKALRYAWEDSPSVFTGTGPAVFNGEGLPATPSLLNITAA